MACNVVIDPEFEGLIPPLEKDELALLEKLILRDGIQDAFKVWAQLPEDWESSDDPPEMTEEEIASYLINHSGRVMILLDGQFIGPYALCHVRSRDFDDCNNDADDLDYLWIDTRDPDAYKFYPDYSCILLDGHNRLRICEAHKLGYPDPIQMVFDSRESARIHMRENQGGRRNVNEAWRIKMAKDNYADAEKIKGKQTQGTRTDILSKVDKKFIPPQAHDTRAIIAAAAKTTATNVARYDVVEKKSPELLEKVLAGEETIHGAYKQAVREIKSDKQEQRRKENAKKVASVKHPDEILKAGAKFATIVIDPPWDCADVGHQNPIGRAKPEYASMSIKKIAALPVADLSDVDCHLYIWITNQMLPLGFSLFDAWGFRYVTTLTWVKPSMGLGSYFRGQTEHVLFGVKGHQLLKRKDMSTVFNAPRGDGGHSSKPIEFYDIVESCSYAPYLEMFSRQERDKWTMWGENSK